VTIWPWHWAPDASLTDRDDIGFKVCRSAEDCDQDRINANDLRTTLAEFDSIWSSLLAREQEQLIQLLVAKIGYDGRSLSRLAPPLPR
jgi:hypothetical protein